MDFDETNDDDFLGHVDHTLSALLEARQYYTLLHRYYYYYYYYYCYYYCYYYHYFIISFTDGLPGAHRARPHRRARGIVTHE